MEREFENGAVVIAGYQKLRMKIISAQLCVGGWRYQLGFMKKDGDIHKRMHHRYFFADNLSRESNLK